MYLQVRDGHITRIEEYLDSGKRAEIKAAREAASYPGTVLLRVDEELRRAYGPLGRLSPARRATTIMASGAPRAGKREMSFSPDRRASTVAPRASWR